MGGCLEFIENLRVGYCDPVEELDELFVDVFCLVEAQRNLVKLGLRRHEVGVGHRAELL